MTKGPSCTTTLHEGAYMAYKYLLNHAWIGCTFAAKSKYSA